MNTRVISLAILAFLMAISISAVAEQAVYEMEKPSDTSPETVITKVIVSDDETIIYMRHTNKHPYYSFPVGLLPPGHESAFFIRDAKSRKKFELLESHGIGIWPAPTHVSPGESLQFVVVFEAIDKDMKRFHLIEGNDYQANDGQETESWHFLNVELK